MMAEKSKLQYRVMDTLEFYECVGKTTTMDEAMKLAAERYEDTGGECELTIQHRKEDGTWEYLTTPKFEDFDE